jgi:hypothetical protein
MGSNRSIALIVALISAVATIMGALIASGSWDPPFVERNQDPPARSPGIELPSVQLPLPEGEEAS